MSDIALYVFIAFTSLAGFALGRGITRMLFGHEDTNHQDVIASLLLSCAASAMAATTLLYAIATILWASAR